MGNNAQQKDYAVMIDYTRTPFTKASAVPTRTGTLQEILPKEKFEDLKKILLTDKGLNNTDVHAILTMPFITPKPTKDNKVGVMAHEIGRASCRERV